VLVKPLLNLFAGEPGGKNFRRRLSEGQASRKKVSE
jgi:hypothetical protein